MAKQSDITDGNTAQWDKLKKARGEPTEPVPSEGTPVIVKGIEPVAPPRERDPETGQFTKKEDVAPPVESTPVETKPVEPPPPASIAPSGEEVEIDGVKVTLDPALAAAFKKADEIKTQTAKVSEREALKAELLAELKRDQPPASTKSQADLEAEAALKAAEDAERALPPSPNDDLMLSDPATWRQMRDARDAATKKIDAERVRIETKREIMAAVEKQNVAAVQDADVRARGILREQFYAVYPTLKNSADLVDPYLDAQFSAVVSSGKLRPNMTPAEGEALKASEFADVATKATRRLVKLKGEAAKVAVSPPPALVSSQPAKAPAPKKVEETKPRQKYPDGSMSRLLKQHQESKTGTSA